MMESSKTRHIPLRLRRCLAILIFLSMPFASSAGMGCGGEPDSFAGAWHGIGGQSGLTMDIIKEGKGVYTMSRTNDDPVRLYLTLGELTGEVDDWKVLKDGSTASLGIRIIATGPDALRVKLTGHVGQKEVGGGSTDWLREGAETPLPLATKFSPSQADLSYLADVLAGMKPLHRAISAVDIAWRNQDAVNGNPRRTQLAIDLSYRLRRKWDNRPPETLSPQLERLSRLWDDARVRSERLIDEAANAYIKIFNGKMPALNADQLLSLLTKAKRAYQRLEPEYKRVIDYQ